MLTEKEKLQRAEIYMIKLANGINPIDNSEIENNNVLNNERLSKCFLYIAEVLDHNINENNTSSKTKKLEFTVTKEELKTLKPLNRDVTISELVNEINLKVKHTDMKKLKSKTINDWLVYKGYLCNKENPKGKLYRELTEKSKYVGIKSKQRTGTFGEYTVIIHSETSQQFIIDNLLDMIEYGNNMEK